MDFWSLLGAYPYLGFTPLGLGFTPLALLWVYPLDWAKPGVYPPNHPGFTPHMGFPPTFRGKGVNPAIDLIMNLPFFGGHGNWISGFYLGFTPLALPWQTTGVSYLGFTSLGLGFTPLALLWVYPFDWAKPGVYPPDHPAFTPQMGTPHVSRQRGKPSNRLINKFDSVFLVSMEIVFLAATWGLHPWEALGSGFLAWAPP